MDALLFGGIHIQTIQSIAGHADTEMTEHYLHVQESIRQSAIQFVQRGVFDLKIGRNGTNYREPAFQSVDINAGSHIAADAVASRKAHLPLRSTR